MRAPGTAGRVRRLRTALAVALGAGVACGAAADVIVDNVRRDAIAATLPEAGDAIVRATLPDGSELSLDDAFDWFEADHLARVQGKPLLEIRRGTRVLTLRFDPLGGTLRVHGAKSTPSGDTLERAASDKDPEAMRVALDRMARDAGGGHRDELQALAATLAASASTSADAADRAIESALSTAREPLWRAFLLEEQARARLRFDKLDAAAEAQLEAMEILAGIRAGSVAHEVARLGLADIELRRHRYAEAEAQLAPALAGLRREAESRTLARALDLQVRLLVEQNRKPAALEPARASLALLRRLDGETVEVASHERLLSTLLRAAGDLPAATKAADEALRLCMSLPDVPPLELADARLERGSVAYLLNDTTTAQDLWTQALDIYRVHEPGGRREANATNNFGVLSEQIGDLAGARRRYKSAMAYFVRDNPQGKDVARALSNLGDLELIAGDYLAAEDYFARAAALQEQLNPQGSPMVSALIGSGSAQARRGQFTTAADSIAKAVGILHRPDFTCGFCQVGNWNEIGWFELLRGHPDDASTYFRRAQDAALKTVPEGDAEAWLGLGEAALARQRPSEARDAFSRAVALRSRYAPQSAEHARALFGLARTYQASEPARARELSCEAARVLDQASTRAGGGALSTAVFRSQYQHIHAACIDALLLQGDVEAAYLKLLDSRAYGFRLALEQRELRFDSRAPAELSQRLRINARDVADAVAQGASLQASDERDAARVKLEELNALRARLVDTLRRHAPKVADLVFPNPASMPASAGGDTVVSYLVSDSHTTIFVAGRRGLHGVRIDVGEGALHESVSRFRRLILEHRPGDAPALHAAGAALYRQLLEPVANHIEAGDTLVFSPDGALRDLPFGALRTPRARYLIEEHAYTVVDSPATLADDAPTASPDTLLAVADAAAPALAKFSGSDPTLRLAAQLPPLPAAREEVSAIARLFAPSATVLTREEASEAEVMRRAPDAGIAHFAVHALLDIERPLDSALVLAGSGADPEDDGLVHVWEILERLRLKADLVVLSGCDTAEGKELRGEGLVGLTRAFQFAGARAVVGSLWSVQDAATAAMMERFYRLRRSSANNAVALREAAREMIVGPSGRVDGPARGAGGLVPSARSSASTSHPFYWAAFQVYGPPR